MLGFSPDSFLDGLQAYPLFPLGLPCTFVLCAAPEAVNGPVFWHSPWMLHALASGSPACANVALSAQVFCSQPHGAALVPGTEALLCMLNKCFTQGREDELGYGRFNNTDFVENLVEVLVKNLFFLTFSVRIKFFNFKTLISK